MKKFIFYLLISLMAASVAQAQYVRKVVRPNFFIPAKELNRVEKLPPFPEYEDENDEEINYVIPAKQKQPTKINKGTVPLQENSHVVVNTTTPPEKVHINFLPVTLDNQKQMQTPQNETAKVMSTHQDLPKVTDHTIPYLNLNTAVIDDAFEQTEEYKKISNQYSQELNILIETGQLPENKDISDALSKMISDDAVAVDENFGK